MKLVLALVALAACKDEVSRTDRVAEVASQQEAVQRVNAALATEGISQKGTTAVTGEAPEAIARSFVDVMASGDARAAIRLIPELEGWSAACRTDVQNAASREVAEAIGGQLVTIPRGVTFVGVERESQRALAAGALLDGCAVTAETVLETAAVRWKTSESVAGSTTLELVRFGARPWAVHRVVR